MLDDLRVGIVGAGYISAVHSAGYRALRGVFGDGVPRIELVRAVDADPARARALADGWGWDAVGSDWREVTRADDIDVVDVCVPNVLHSEIAIDALAHGKHVVCEKPLAATVPDAQAMAAAAEGSDRLAQVCFYYRLWPAIAWAQRLIAEGRIGTVQHVRGWMLQDYAADPSLAMGWRTSRTDAGAGALGDIGSHIFDIARALAGDVERVSAFTRAIVDRADGNDVDDLAAALVQFESGATGVLEASWALRGHKTDLGFDVAGSAGAISFAWERSNEIVITTSGGGERVLIGPTMPGAEGFSGTPGQGLGYRDAFAIGLGRFASALRAGTTDVGPTFTDGLRACEFVAAAIDSAESGRWIDLPRPG